MVTVLHLPKTTYTLILLLNRERYERDGEKEKKGNGKRRRNISHGK